MEPRVGQQEAVQHNRVLGKSTSEAQDSHQDFNSEFGEFLAVFQVRHSISSAILIFTRTIPTPGAKSSDNEGTDSQGYV